MNKMKLLSQHFNKTSSTRDLYKDKSKMLSNGTISRKNYSSAKARLKRMDSPDPDCYYIENMYSSNRQTDDG